MLTIIKEAFASQPKQAEPPLNATRKTIAILQQELQTADAFVAEIENQLAGCLLFAQQDGGIYFGRLAVLPPSSSKHFIGA